MMHMQKIIITIMLLTPGLAFSWENAPGVQYFYDRQQVQTLISEEEFQQAYDLLNKLNGINPKDASQYRLQGLVAEQLGLWAEAGAAYSKALELGAPFELSTAYRAAQSFSRSGQTDKALYWLERALFLGLDRRFDLPEDEAFSGLLRHPRFIQMTGLEKVRLTDRTERWRRDVDFLVSEAQRIHASPERPAYSDKFLEQATAIKESIPEQTDTEIMMNIQRLVALLRDGHSYVWVGSINDKALQPVTVDGRKLPVFFHFFGDHLYIINGYEDGAALIGDRVLEIGNLPVEMLIQKAQDFLHADNSESWKFLGVHFAFNRLPLHMALGTAADGEVSFKTESRSGKIRDTVLRAGHYEFPRKLRPMSGQANVAEFLQHVDVLFREKAYPEQSAYYLQINNIRNDPDGESLAAFSERAVGSALATGSNNLIVDFRLNNGGNNTLCNPLLKQLLRFEFSGEKQRIFMITRHETFSAAQNCITRIEAMTDALFVGEPSSSSPNFTGEETQIMLPYSGLMVSISNRYWQDSLPWDNRPWIPMDIPVEMTFEDYVEGHDPALEAVFQVIENTGR